MTCRRGIIAARKHAALVEDVQACAPPVTAPYLRDAYARMRLPLHVRVKDWRNGHGDQFGLWDGSCDPGRGGPWLTADPAAATRIYFDLVSHPKFATLLKSAPVSLGTPPGAEPAVVANAPALSSPSAVPSADDAPSRRVCGGAAPGPVASISVAP